VKVKELQYLYREGDELVFINPRTYEKLTLSRKTVTDFLPLIMKKGENYQVFVLDNQAVAIRPPLKVQELAIKIHQILNCRGFSRTDFIINQNQEPVVLEINTIPGLTPPLPFLFKKILFARQFFG